MDVFPYNRFALGAASIVEDYVVINNGVGDVVIGEDTIVGIGSVIIGPVQLGNHVMLAQHVVVSGLNHEFADVSLPIKQQSVTTRRITIHDGAWIGANAVITAGVTIGAHAVVGSGSVVTKEVAAFTVVVGNPARAIKVFNQETQQWERAKNE